MKIDLLTSELLYLLKERHRTYEHRYSKARSKEYRERVKDDIRTVCDTIVSLERLQQRNIPF